MDNEHGVLDKTPVQAVLAKDFVFIKLYTNKGDVDAVRELRKRFEGAANPWYVFLAPDGRVLKKFGGRLTIPGFLEQLEWAKQQSGRVAKTH